MDLFLCRWLKVRWTGFAHTWGEWMMLAHMPITPRVLPDPCSRLAGHMPDGDGVCRYCGGQV